MRRESHRYRGVRRSSRGAGWGHRAVYVASAIAAASLVAGFGLAGYWFGTFSHVYNQSTATGFESAPYGVKFLSAGVTSAGLVSWFNWNQSFNNTTFLNTGPCSTLNYSVTSSLNGTTVNQTAVFAGDEAWMNQTGAQFAINLTDGNGTNNSVNGNHTIICLNSVFNGTISYLWQNYSGVNPMNNTTDPNGSWNNISAPANLNFATPYFNISQGWLFNASNNSSDINITGCNPYASLNNTTLAFEKLANCGFFVGNNQTTFLPHAGFYLNSTTNNSWFSLDNNTSDYAAYWHPGQNGYLPSDTVFYVTLAFQNMLPNMTYEVVLSLAGATPLPQVFFVNTGPGLFYNATLTFVFDMTAAWMTAFPMGNMTAGGYGYYANNTTNSTEGFASDVIAAIDTFSATVSQCYIDASGMLACPDSLGGTAMP